MENNTPMAYSLTYIPDSKVLIVFLLFVFVTYSNGLYAQNDLPKELMGNAVSDSQKEEIEQNLQNLPASFRKNGGQWNDDILFESGSSGIHMYFMKNGISYASVRTIDDEMKPRSSDGTVRAGNNHEYLVWNMKFVGCNKHIKYSSEGEHKSKINYLLGNDPSRFVTNASDYSLICYHDLYEKIDARYYTSGNKIKYDYVVKPGGKMDQIKMSFEGIKKLSIKKEGTLEIETAWGSQTDMSPYSYQFIKGVRKEVDVRYYLLNDSTVGFYTKGYVDPGYDLVIDPVILYYSTYVGAAGPNSGALIWGYTYDIVADAQGNAYVTGWYDGAGFPTKPGNYDASYNTMDDIVVFKVKPDGTDLVYGTYIGGNSRERGHAIAIDNAGNAYVTGYTASANFPVTGGAYDVTYTASSQAFVLKLNATGSALVYSSFLGDQADGKGIVVNASGEAFITGVTFSSVFPTTLGCFDNSFNGGISDAFVAKLNSTGSTLLYSTFVGGSTDAMGIGNVAWNDFGGEGSCRIALDPSGDVYITGFTNANDFPTTPGCYDPTMNNAVGTRDGDGVIYKLRLNGNGAADMIYSTFFGGSGNDQSFDIAVNSTGSAFVTGLTLSPNFPTTLGAYDTNYDTPCVSGSSNVFLVELNPSGNALVYSTFVGSHGIGMSVQVNSKDQAYVNVAYPEKSIPLTGGFCGKIQDVPVTTCSFKNVKTNGTGVGLYKFNSTGSKLLFTGWIGGTNIDGDFGNTHIALVKNGCNEDLLMTAVTHSSDFPTTPGAFQTTKLNLSSSEDQPVVCRFTQVFNANFTFPAATCNTPVAFNNITEQCGMWDSVQTWLWDFGDGATSNLISPQHTYTAPGTYTVKLISYCPDDTVTKNIIVTGVCNTCNIVGQFTKGTASCPGCGCKQWVMINAAGGTSPYSYTWPDGYNNRYKNHLCPGAYIVNIKDKNGCSVNVNLNTP